MKATLIGLKLQLNYFISPLLTYIFSTYLYLILLKFMSSSISPSVYFSFFKVNRLKFWGYYHEKTSRIIVVCPGNHGVVFVTVMLYSCHGKFQTFITVLVQVILFPLACFTVLKFLMLCCRGMFTLFVPSTSPTHATLKVLTEVCKFFLFFSTPEL